MQSKKIKVLLDNIQFIPIAFYSLYAQSTNLLIKCLDLFF